MKMIKDKYFYKLFFSMYVILVLQSMLTLSVNLADNIMLGGYSEKALAGVATVNQIQFIYQQMLLAIGEGIVILGSQYFGKKQLGTVKIIASEGMHIAFAVFFLLFFFTSILPGTLLSIFTTDELIIEQGLEYLKIIRFTFLPFAITQILLATLRSTGIVKIAFYLSVSTLVINCGVNYILIYGRFGLPELGVQGAAIGTLTARIVECLILIGYIVRREKNLNLHIKDLLKSNKMLRIDYYKVMFPVFLVNSLWGLNTALQTVILGHMNSSAIAANSIASTLFMMAKSMAIGAATAASFIIGKTVGEDDPTRLRQYAKTMQILFACIGIVSGMLLFIIRIPVLSLYQMKLETREMANAFLNVLSIVCVGMSYQMPTNIGIVRGGGSSKFVMKMDLISIWCIVIPLSLYMAFIVKASPVTVVCCLNADQIFKCIPAFIKTNYGHWAKKLTRD
jgi:putative MATE family efflux protein